MADHPNQMLDELLKQEQEPFHLNAFIKQKRSQLRRTARSGFRDDTVSIQVPSNTATLLAEAAERIQKRPKTGFFSSFLKWVIVKDCNLLIGDHNGVKSSYESNDSNTKRRGLSSDGDFCVAETRFCSSPFKFSFRRSTSSSGRCSSATSPPSHLVKREKEENQDEEQSSPVSVLETSLGDSYGDESRDSEDHEINVRRLRDGLLNRIRRFEKLAESNSLKLDQMESANSEDDSQVSMKIEEDSDDDDDEPLLSLYKKERAEAFVSELCFIPIPPSPKKSHKFLEKDKGINRETNINKMLLNKRALWKQVKSDGIEAMVRLELKCGDRKHSDEQIEEIVREIELEISEQLLDELCAVVVLLFPLISVN